MNVSKEIVTLTRKEYYELKDEGWKDVEIAEEHFFSIASLNRWKKKNGLVAERKPLTMMFYLAMKSKGYEDKEIAAMTGNHPATISKFRKTYKLGDARKGIRHGLQ